TLLIKEDGSLSPRAEKILAHTPQGRFGTPEDLAGTLLWLADDASSGFVNGVVVPVDGGFAAYSGV
ncbi:MAG TPA: SDR family oxidoreductase, partial [Clostridiales bacterium]|nr:SDR family oxidoreductase [Clostridiales bacterium]